MPFNFTLHATNPNAREASNNENFFTSKEYTETLGGTEVVTDLMTEVFGTDTYKAVVEYATLFDMSEEEAANVLGDIYTDSDFTTNKWTI